MNNTKKYLTTGVILTIALLVSISISAAENKPKDFYATFIVPVDNLYKTFSNTPGAADAINEFVESRIEKVDHSINYLGEQIKKMNDQINDLYRQINSLQSQIRPQVQPIQPIVQPIQPTQKKPAQPVQKKSEQKKSGKK